MMRARPEGDVRTYVCLYLSPNRQPKNGSLSDRFSAPRDAGAAMMLLLCRMMPPLLAAAAAAAAVSMYPLVSIQ